MNKLKRTATWATEAAVLATIFARPVLGSTVPAIDQGADAAHNQTNTPADLTVIIGSITNTLIYIVGVVAVIFLIIGGLRYVVTGGDPKGVEAAKNTILYAIIGIVVALLAYALVNFVVGRVTTPA